MSTIRKTHAPRTRDGLAQIGPSRYDVAGIRFFNDGEGAGGGDPAQPAPAAPAAPPAPTPPPVPQPPAPQPPAAAEPPAPVSYRGNPDEYVRELREEAKTHRIAAETAQTERNTIQQERDTLASERDALARERALLLAAPKHGARADLLLDSSSFMKTFADVDLANEEAVTKAITDAIEKNSTFKAAPSLPGMSGGGHQGGSAPASNPTLESAVRGALGG